MMKYALRPRKPGLDVFATIEHHNPPFVPASPTPWRGGPNGAARL
jgi:hypothetical protein